MTSQTVCKLDQGQPFSYVYGHPVIKYEQGGVNFDRSGNYVHVKPKETQTDVIETPRFDSAKAFLLQILKSGSLSKSVIYKTAQDNNQEWEMVKQAAQIMKLVVFKQSGAERWKLPEELSEV